MLKKKLDKIFFKAIVFLIRLIGLKPPNSFRGYEAMLFIDTTWGTEKYYYTIFTQISTIKVDKFCVKRVVYNLIEEFHNLPDIKKRVLSDLFDDNSHWVNGGLYSIWKSIFKERKLYSESVHELIKFILLHFERVSDKKEVYLFLALMCDVESAKRKTRDIASLQRRLVEFDRVPFKESR